MDFELSDRCKELRERLLAFMDEHVYPAESVYHEQLLASGDPHSHPPVMEELKDRAREVGPTRLTDRDCRSVGLVARYNHARHIQYRCNLSSDGGEELF